MSTRNLLARLFLVVVSCVGVLLVSFPVFAQIQLTVTGVLPPTENGVSRVVGRLWDVQGPPSDAPLLQTALRAQDGTIDVRQHPVASQPFREIAEGTTYVVVIDASVNGLATTAFGQQLIGALTASGRLGDQHDALGIVILDPSSTSQASAQYLPPARNPGSRFEREASWLQTHNTQRGTQSPIYTTLSWLVDSLAGMALSDSLPSRREVVIITDAISEDHGPTEGTQTDALAAQIAARARENGIPISAVLINAAGRGRTVDLSMNTRLQGLVAQTAGELVSVHASAAESGDRGFAAVASAAGDLLERLQAAYVLPIPCYNQTTASDATRITLNAGVLGPDATVQNPGPIRRGTHEVQLPIQWVRCQEQRALCAVLPSCGAAGAATIVAPEQQPPSGTGATAEQDASGAEHSPDAGLSASSDVELLAPTVPAGAAEAGSATSQPGESSPPNYLLWALIGVVVLCFCVGAWMVFGPRGDNEDDDEPTGPEGKSRPDSVPGTGPPNTPAPVSATPATSTDWDQTPPQAERVPNQSHVPTQLPSDAVEAARVAGPAAVATQLDSTPKTPTPRGAAPLQPSPTTMLRRLRHQQHGPCLVWLQEGRLAELPIPAGESILAAYEKGLAVSTTPGSPYAIRVQWQPGQQMRMSSATSRETALLEGAPLGQTRDVVPGMRIVVGQLVAEVRWMSAQPGLYCSATRAEQWQLTCISDDYGTTPPVRVDATTTILGRAPSAETNEDRLVEIPATASAQGVGKVSSNHVALWVSGGFLFVRDLSSTNGAYAPGAAQRLAPNTPSPLTEGNELWLGANVGFRVSRA